MEIKNLERAAQIADELPRLEKARKMLSNIDGSTKVTVTDEKKGMLEPIEQVELPHSVHMNIINILNLEINSLREEAKKL
jgi:hypothetical protein